MAARFCPQCGKEVSSTARFCPNCAASLTQLPAPSPSGAGGQETTPMEMAAQGSRRLLVPAMIAALVVLTVAVILLMSHKPQPSVLVAQPAPVAPAPPLVSAPVTPVPAAPPVISAPTAPTTPAPAVTNAPTQPAPTLPPDVAAYLTFLQGIEKQRIVMNSDMSGANAMMGLAQQIQTDKMDPESENENSAANVGKISQGYSDYSVKWQTLIRDFRAQTPPQACTELSNQYLKFLSDYTTVIGKLQVSILNHDSKGLPLDMGGVMQVQSQMNTDAGLADTELGNLCARYGVAKPFAISPDGSSSSLLGQ